MIQLTPQDIALRSRATTKEAAIREVGQLLVKSGAIAPGYIESMLGREKQADTFLGNGIAIPHGMQADRELIHHTAIAIVQVRDGVVWNGNQVVRLVVGIAARSDEHLGVLAALTDVLDDSELSRRLAEAEDPQIIIAALRRSPARESAQPEQLAGAVSVEVSLLPGAGLHARPATVFVDEAAQFHSEIRVEFNGKTANGKSMASLLKLGIDGGSTLRIVASGVDAEAALTALKAAVESGLGEAEEVKIHVDEVLWSPASELSPRVSGISASPGIAIGPLFHLQTSRIIVEDALQTQEDAETEIRDALQTAHDQLTDIYDAVKDRCGKQEAAIFRAHQAFLTDPDLLKDVLELIEMGHGAAWSWQQIINQRVAEVAQVNNERLSGRAVDLHDVGQRVLRLLAPSEQGEITLPDHPVILVAEDLTPSHTARLDPKRILGLCTALGGATSHTAIIARSLDLPAMVGAGPALLEQTDGVLCILDGSAGSLYVAPSEADLRSAENFQIDLQHRRDIEYQTRYQPAILTDDHRIEVVANISKPSEAALAVEAGAEGVGLMRTEFLFLSRNTPPTEEEQFEAYSAMTSALNGLPLIIRTLDIGGDKAVPYLSLPHEDNPFLGTRGIRLCLRQPELFIPQLRAIYRASTTGPIKIMFPMVATLEELREGKEIAEKVRKELGVAPVEIGIMVEVPSAALMAPELAREADFFSIGTNDLAQYVYAMDRMHPVLTKQVDALHPAVLRMIEMTTRAAAAAGKWVGVCGGIAGDPRGAIILAGLGVTELSMSLPSIAAIKARLRKISLAQARTIAAKALTCQSAAEVRDLIIP
ncbi:MAG: phosphoenolpyruvate--protein phosphotransferase [Chthoniobacteraceae bacterium]